jgi:hypothetical protein
MKTLLEWTAKVKKDRFYGIKGVYSYTSFYTRPNRDIKDAKVREFSFYVFSDDIYSYSLDSRFILLSDKGDFTDYKYVALNLDHFVVAISVEADWDDDRPYYFKLYTEDGRYKLLISRIYIRHHDDDEYELVGIVDLEKRKFIKNKNISLFGNTVFKFKRYKDFSELELDCFKELRPKTD